MSSLILLYQVYIGCHVVSMPSLVWEFGWLGDMRMRGARNVFAGVAATPTEGSVVPDGGAGVPGGWATATRFWGWIVDKCQQWVTVDNFHHILSYMCYFTAE